MVSPSSILIYSNWLPNYKLSISQIQIQTEWQVNIVENNQISVHILDVDIKSTYSYFFYLNWRSGSGIE